MCGTVHPTKILPAPNVSNAKAEKSRHPEKIGEMTGKMSNHRGFSVREVSERLRCLGLVLQLLHEEALERGVWSKANIAVTHSAASAWTSLLSSFATFAWLALFYPLWLSLKVTYLEDLPRPPDQSQFSQTPRHHPLPHFPLLFLHNAYHSFELYIYLSASWASVSS